MPPRRRDHVDDVLDRDNLRHLEQRMEQIMNQRMDRMMELLTQMMAALIGNQNQENPGGDREPEFDEDDYDEDDKEADAVWEAIDKRMDSQRKDRREARLKREIKNYRASNQ
ncbi:hypothetical protein CDL15_Pgr023740 [Punica granatum]|uniref:PRP1 splicing factor N-terminal domain-containing protein n=1 Tax=Punica granatum TaxID=22663 RepID=A0A218WRS8_PUNGR|nr:hypothetical protein CDL15_Pgr023740 [Punica granatum]